MTQVAWGLSPVGQRFARSRKKVPTERNAERENIRMKERNTKVEKTDDFHVSSFIRVNLVIIISLVDTWVKHMYGFEDTVA